MIFFRLKITKTLLVLNKLIVSGAVLYTIALAVVSLLDSSNFPEHQLENSDKVGHVLAYLVLCLVWYLAFKTLNTSKALIIASSFSVIYGIVLEVLQETLSDSRTSDVYDILANSVGVVIISIIILIRNKTHVKNL